MKSVWWAVAAVVCAFASLVVVGFMPAAQCRARGGMFRRVGSRVDTVSVRYGSLMTREPRPVDVFACVVLP